MEFGHLIALLTLIGIVVGVVVIVIANKKGVDVSSLRFRLSVLIGFAIIFFIIPILLFADIPIIGKLFIIVPSIIVGFAYFAFIYSINQRNKNKK